MIGSSRQTTSSIYHHASDSGCVSSLPMAFVSYIQVEEAPCTLVDPTGCPISIINTGCTSGGKDDMNHLEVEDTPSKDHLIASTGTDSSKTSPFFQIVKMSVSAMMKWCLLTVPLLLVSCCSGLAVTTSKLSSVSIQQPAWLDGAEWASVQDFCDQSKVQRYTPCGSMTVMTGILQGERVVGIGNSEDLTTLYPQSVSKIPPNVSDKDAISTLIAALAGVHCVLPRIAGVGGSQDEVVVQGKCAKVVIMGGSDYASFCAKGLAALGAHVHIVSTGTPNVPNHVHRMAPATDDIGFASVVATFDVLLDTLSDETRLGETSLLDNDTIITRSGSGVVALLHKRHKCSRYISTMTASQRIVRDSGVVFGPKKAQEQVEQIGPTATPIVPPKHFGTTVQRLLDDNILYKWQFKGPIALRTWNLPDFWELASWPRDSSGGANVRFGLPVIDDLGLDLLLEQIEKEETANKRIEYEAEAVNPFVTSIVGIDGLQQEIINTKKDCILFLSAPFCRTCRSLAPSYTRMARMNDNDITFAKADTSGKVGKELGKALEIEAVPAFILFRNGRRYGTPLSVTKIPSKKLSLAFELLSSGKEWDNTAFQEFEQEGEEK